VVLPRDVGARRRRSHCRSGRGGNACELLGWAKIEAAAARGASYAPPADRGDYAGLIVSLARQEQPDTSAYTDPEIVWRLSKHHHVGLIVRSRNQRRVEELLDRYTARFTEDFVASMPMRQSPVE